MRTPSSPNHWRVHNSTELGRVLARVRTTAGISQANMAERIGVHRPYLSGLEQGAATEQLNRIFSFLAEAGYEITIALKAAGDAP